MSRKSAYPPSISPRGGKLVANLMHFARLLRAVGLPIGPGRVIEAIRALEAVGVHRREDFYWALHAVFVSRGDQRAMFDQAFRRFWRDPTGLEAALSALLPSLEVPGAHRKPTGFRRLAEAWSERAVRAKQRGGKGAEVESAMTYSDREILHRKDFEQMSAEEIQRAKEAIARMHLPFMDAPTYRFRADPRGARLDLRATLRASQRSAGEDMPLRWKAPRRRPPPLVAICDISGSMSRYSRMLLHFLHTLANQRERVHSFVFGTRLTNVTRHLGHRDVDEAFARMGAAVEDWSGGTRIGSCLGLFNRLWSRRVLAQGAVVLLITDGLDRELGPELEREVERLQKSCRRLIWLNPLLRYEGFQPRARGIRAILPHVDLFRPVHNLESLDQLAEVLRENRRDRPTRTVASTTGFVGRATPVGLS